MKKIEVILLCILLFAGFFYRVYDLSHDSYWIDESYTVLSSKNIGTYGYPKFESGDNYFGAFPLSYSLFVLGESFGYGHIPMRILSVIVGTAFIALMYFLIRRFYAYKIALLVAGLLTFSYLQIAWSRQARAYIFLEFLCFLSIYFYLQYLENKKIKFVFWTLASVIFAYLFHPLGLIMLPVLGIHYILIRKYKIIEDIKSFFNGIKVSKYSLIVSIIIATAILYYVWSNLGNMKIVADYFSNYKSYLFQTSYVMICLAVIGFFSFKNHFKNNLLFAIFFIFTLLAASFIIYMVNFRYIFIVLPVLIILASQAIIYLFELNKNIIYKIAIGVFFISLLIFSGVLFPPLRSYSLEPQTPQPPFFDAYAYVKGEITTDDLLIVTQPAISELYLRKPDYWLAIGYENKGIKNLYDSRTLRESYTNSVSIIDEIVLARLVSTEGYIIIDDMGIRRLPKAEREIVLNLTLEKKYGTEYWKTVYVYSFGKDY